MANKVKLLSVVGKALARGDIGNDTAKTVKGNVKAGRIDTVRGVKMNINQFARNDPFNVGSVANTDAPLGELDETDSSSTSPTGGSSGGSSSGSSSSSSSGGSSSKPDELDELADKAHKFAKGETSTAEVVQEAAEFEQETGTDVGGKVGKALDKLTKPEKKEVAKERTTATSTSVDPDPSTPATSPSDPALDGSTMESSGGSSKSSPLDSLPVSKKTALSLAVTAAVAVVLGGSN